MIRRNVLPELLSTLSLSETITIRNMRTETLRPPKEQTFMTPEQDALFQKIIQTARRLGQAEHRHISTGEDGREEPRKHLETLVARFYLLMTEAPK